jgi:hypothetical protein
MSRRAIGWIAVGGAAATLLLMPIGDFRVDLPVAGSLPTPSNFSFTPDPVVFPFTMVSSGLLAACGAYLLLSKPN